MCQKAESQASAFCETKPAAYLRRFCAGSRLLINEAKARQAGTFGCKFLSCALWVVEDNKAKCAVTHKALGNIQVRIGLLGAPGRRSLSQVVKTAALHAGMDGVP